MCTFIYTVELMTAENAVINVITANRKPNGRQYYHRSVLFVVSNIIISHKYFLC